MKKTLLTLLALTLIMSIGFSFTLGLSVSTLNNPFFVALKDGAVEKAEELNIDLIVADARDNPAKQLNDIEDMIQRKVDLIIINPTDSDAIASSVEEANDANIPVITVDRGSNGGKVLLHIASDNIAGGAMAAEFIAEKLNQKGKVIELVGIPGTSAARDRGAGFDQGISKYKDIKVVARQTANFNRAEGLVVMENLLQSNPDVNAVFAQNDEMALGAIEALKSAGKLKNVVVVGFDAVPDAVKSVQNKEMAATIAQQPEKMGGLAVTKAVEYLNTMTVYFPVDLKLVK
ncbi:ribose ABC transporter substrate-binding protein RbsB [Oceanotoga sp. DSM 15011]|jgi:ribose transport system substrate-binding protein|uniref:Monosaccharide ABC transporter substrate-binding protein (CUT2 family) n=1 Tax=Oceanotoga teriensis TaxID=515440 RepID=A0AA45C739_9BACT|nr:MULTISPECIES: ribose ABC transporter substrate-binding protein RbsB [Oceanotoga]MDO7975896.1 ribose ABC transporter substrate-binding protein RbsB [Oceanotoga teriensis]PWJ95127.1 monosaccharide ABC transporter substrate-binding protein (CUT2 family) [Oceanotoga teriensis]UYO99119.1 ribose ABC transporter substrate-binding protein RbsB [Oceanotoga sp. DSM 15011]